MNDAALAAVHGIELIRHKRFPDFFRYRDGAETEFFDPQQTMIVRVKTQSRMFVAWDAQHFHGEVFKRKHQFGFVCYQQVFVFAGELDHQVRGFKSMMGACTVGDMESDDESSQVQDMRQE